MDEREMETTVISLTEWRRLMDEKIDQLVRDQKEFENQVRNELHEMGVQQGQIFDKMSNMLDKRFNELEEEFLKVQRAIQKIVWVFTGVTGAVGVFWLLLMDWDKIKALF